MAKNTIQFDPSALEDDADQAHEVIPYAGFSGSTGEWTYGFNGDILGDVDILCVGADSIKKGFIGWSAGEVVDERMVSIFDKKNQVKESDLDAIETKSEMDGWKPQRSVVIMINNQPHELKGTSHGITQWFNNLANDIVRQYSRNPDYRNPMIKVGNTSYKHKTYKKVFFNPTYQIMGWCNNNFELLQDKVAIEEVEDAERVA